MIEFVFEYNRQNPVCRSVPSLQFSISDLIPFSYDLDVTGNRFMTVVLSTTTSFGYSQTRTQLQNRI
jgi:hypothetical protein